MKIEPHRRGEAPALELEQRTRNELRSPVAELEHCSPIARPSVYEERTEIAIGEGAAPLAPSRLEGLGLEDECGFSHEALRRFRSGLDDAGHDGRELPIRLVEFTRAFYLGGTETQLVELLRGLPRHYQVRVGAIQAQGPLFEKVQTMGHMPRTFPLGERFLRPATVKQIGRLASWLRDERIELLHVHDFAATLLAVPAAKLAGCKVIVSRLDLAHYHSSLQRSILAQLTRMADHVIVNAEAIRTMVVQEDGVRGDRVSLVRNGIDLRRFDERRALGLEAPLPETGGDPVVVHVANMNHPVKRQEDLIEAVRQLKAGGTKVRAFLVGDGPRRLALEQAARASGLEDCIHFLGHRTDVPAIYERASLGVLCSSAEGLSNAIIEGMAAQLPMVVTDVGGSAELVGNGSRGWVVPPMKPDALAKAMAEVLRDRSFAREIGRRARAYVERELTVEQMVNSHDAVYRCVCRARDANSSSR